MFKEKLKSWRTGNQENINVVQELEMQEEKTGVKLECGQVKKEKEQRKKREDKLGWRVAAFQQHFFGIGVHNPYIPLCLQRLPGERGVCSPPAELNSNLGPPFWPSFPSLGLPSSSDLQRVQSLTFPQQNLPIRKGSWNPFPLWCEELRSEGVSLQRGKDQSISTAEGRWKRQTSGSKWRGACSLEQEGSIQPLWFPFNNSSDSLPPIKGFKISSLGVGSKGTMGHDLLLEKMLLTRSEGNTHFKLFYQKWFCLYSFIGWLVLRLTSGDSSHFFNCREMLSGWVLQSVTKWSLTGVVTWGTRELRCTRLDTMLLVRKLHPEKCRA